MGSDILGKSDSIVGQSKRVGKGVITDRIFLGEGVGREHLLGSDPKYIGPD